MARASIKNNRNASNNAEYGLLKKWGAMIGAVDQHTLDKMNGMLKFVKQSAGDQIYLKAMTDSRLSAYDEKIYICYDRLMACYRVIVEIYNENTLLFSDNYIKNIYDGLFDIFVSRTKSFEETGAEAAQAEKPNPISIEKNNIIFDSLRIFGRDFDQRAHQFKTEKQREIILNAREKFLLCMDAATDAALTGELADALFKSCGGMLYKLFTETVRMTILQLNDLERRKTVAYYFELLSREQDILSNLIKVQAGALETSMKQGAEDARTVAVIQLILKNLREIYQHYGKEADEILAIHRAGVIARKDAGQPEETAANDALIGGVFEAARAETEDAAAFAAVKEKFEAAQALLKESLYKAVKHHFEAVTQTNIGGKETLSLKKAFSQTETMAEQMTAAFEYIAAYYKEEKECLLSDGENAEILAGIAETIEIKIDSIRENRLAFRAAAEKSAASAAGVRPEISPEEIAAAAEQCYETVLLSLKSLGRDDRRGIGAALIRRALFELSEREAVARYYEKLEKARHQKFEDAHKKSVRFIKDHLLFEMMTFEEINVYSVSRLRESANPAIAALVAVIDRQTAVLTGILKQNGIEPIHPAPHDPFNGKEHEVLMAEKNEEYKKGEIIKVMNGGYKYGETVLLRANVIAAR
ncbi:MAG: nucleotide exchange factor GrpE [Clostridiales bacterium]|jgi:molecular chaperone GrpE (heat shock protein)|nr:nucleotide exchange factor GrpE [Clostridiales bacterium]